MLTVKVMSPGGGEEIHCGLSVGFNALTYVFTSALMWA